MESLTKALAAIRLRPMPSGLRSRIALFALMGAFLIPITVSGLRGLTHVLTCTQKAETPFTVIVKRDGAPTVITSSRLEKGATNELCGGLVLDLRARGQDQHVQMIVLITNNTSSLWRGTVNLALEGQTSLTFPVDIGEIPAGATAQDEIDMTLTPGATEVAGALLIGP